MYLKSTTNRMYKLSSNFIGDYYRELTEPWNKPTESVMQAT